MSAEKPRYMDLTERRLAKTWKEEGVEVEEIARRLERDKTSIWRALKKAEPPAGVGRKMALTDDDKTRLAVLTEKMVQEANARYMVTRAMIQKRFQPAVCDRVIANAQHERGIWMHAMRQKPILTEDDVKARYAWAKKYRHKPPSWWKRTVHLHIDNKAFKVPATSVARRHLAAQRIARVYRSRGKALRPEHVRAGRGVRHNSGVRHVLIAGGIGKGRVRLWHVVPGAWGADAASRMYEGPLLQALKRAHPGKRLWRVLEDNDPGGYQTRKAQTTKAKLHIEQFAIPSRSPDLNVMDYYVWAEVERRLRAEERAWDEDYRESRDDFIGRLRRTAKAIPMANVQKAIGDLSWRAKALYKAKGGLFEEGGRRGRRG